MHKNITDVIVIGAGPAGLAVGGCLERAGVSFLILDSASTVGSRWTEHYDRLHLHTAKRFSALPYQPYPADYPRFPSKEQFWEYLANYARPFQDSLRLDQTVTVITRSEPNWDVHTAKTVYHAPVVVIATGYNHTPVCPEWPEQAQYVGKIIHSRAYKNALPYRGKRVLVVGFGNTGAEIAIDLFEQGAESHVSVRNPVNFTFRELFGIPYQYLAIPLNQLPSGLVDGVTAPIGLLKYGKFEQYGLQKLPYGTMTQVKKYGHVPTFDIGIVSLIRQKQVKVHPGIERFTTDGVVFINGSREAYDAVILATGYRPRLARLLPYEYTLLNNDGYPLSSGKPTAAPGLYFCGFQNTAVGLLYTIGIEARKITAHIQTSGQMASTR